MQPSHDSPEAGMPNRPSSSHGNRHFDRYRHREGPPAPSAGASASDSASVSAPTSASAPGAAGSLTTPVVTSDSHPTESPPTQIVSDIPTHPRLASIHAHSDASNLTKTAAKTAARTSLPNNARVDGHGIGKRNGNGGDINSRAPLGSAPHDIPQSRLGSASAPQHRSSGPAPGMSFPSPGREQVQRDPRFVEDHTKITDDIRQAVPEAVRCSIRDNWENTLLGSAFHQAFVLNASIHHISQDAIRRSIRDFGTPLVAKAKHEIVDIMSPTDLDELADRILAKANNAFLDKALDKRLKTMESRRLVNALARAERLGYDLGDVTEDKDLPPEEFSPLPAALSHSVTSPQPAASHLPMHCGICFRRFTHQSAFEYHVNLAVCTRSPGSPGGFKFNCQHCGQGFTSVVQLQHHNSNKACGDFNDAQLPGCHTPAATRVLYLPNPTTPALGGKTPKVAPSTGARISTPHQGTPGTVKAPGADADPYANLSPEQIAALQAELIENETKYGDLLRQARNLPPPERNTRFHSLCNSYSTKQSNIRKKYGVRLRTSKKKGNGLAEKSRVQYKTAAELMADNGLSAHDNASEHVGVRARPVGDGLVGSTPGARARASVSGPPSGQEPRSAMQPQPAPGTLASSLPDSDPEIQFSESVSMHKRRYDGQGSSSPNHKRSNVANYVDMGGLGGASADAEMVDPTGTANQPAALDSSEDDEEECKNDGESSDDEDIPARLPASVA